METFLPNLIDQYNRRLNYLRISITDRCNLRCLYCMPRDGLAKLKHEEVLTYEEILRLAGIAVGLGVNKIRLTGGEPLIRKGLSRLLPGLAGLPHLKDISMTTNGIFLKDNLEWIRSAGMRRINISLDTLHRERYRKITGFDGLERVWEGIRAAEKLGFYPVKINMVVMKGINDDEVVDFARLSLDHPYHIRYIEYMPSGFVHGGGEMEHVPNSTVKARLMKIGKLDRIPHREMDGPTVRFRFEGAPGEVGFISPLTHHFCQACNRLRLTASGHLRPCLLSNGEIDIKTPLRAGASDRDLARIFLKAAENKPGGHGPVSEQCGSLCGQMSAIGG
ncbi:MAG TPA: GTP 3',8-cyclase MoaA [Deltaproteobacteria bacterium]|nr:GTP 3',8-cyclase MoaA [Deltaproteobacteria bacterium]